MEKAAAASHEEKSAIERSYALQLNEAAKKHSTALTALKQSHALALEEREEVVRRRRPEVAGRELARERAERLGALFEVRELEDRLGHHLLSVTCHMIKVIVGISAFYFFEAFYLTLGIKRLERLRAFGSRGTTLRFGNVPPEQERTTMGRDVGAADLHRDEPFARLRAFRDLQY